MSVIMYLYDILSTAGEPAFKQLSIKAMLLWRCRKNAKQPLVARFFSAVDILFFSQNSGFV